MAHYGRILGRKGREGFPDPVSLAQACCLQRPVTTWTPGGREGGRRPGLSVGVSGVQQRA